MKTNILRFALIILCIVTGHLTRCAAAVRVEPVDEQHRQAFIQTDNQLRYLVDGISLHLHQDLTADSELPVLSSNVDTISSYPNPVTFYPSELNFKEHPVGMPDVATVIVSNPNLHNVYLLSISGSSVHFHCSFFQDKVIPPGENTTFSIVFLSRHEGPIQNTLYIHTSAGSYKYEVYGVGTPNPYRLRPFLGAKVPLNSVYSSVINMYNPHSSTLQVTEMYSSGGDLHLELPTGEREAMRQLWEIQPYETKSVMRASFVARVENNHTVYIRIKTNSSNDNYLVLPVEVEVSSAPGIYTTTDTLEFGIMYCNDTPRTLALHLLNRSTKPVQITSVSASPSNDALSIVFQSVKVPPDTTQPIKVAEITFHPLKALTSSQFMGKIVIRSKNSQFKLPVPYMATVLHGFLEYNASGTEFYVGELRKDESLQRNLTLRNTFNVSVAIHHIELPDDAKALFEVNLFESLVLHANEMKAVGVIKLINFTNNAPLNTHLRFHTNVSQFDVPLLCYNGKLSKFLPAMENDSKMDLGTLSLGERRDVVFALINENPIDIHIKGFGATVVHSVVEFMGVARGNISEIIYDQNFTGFSKKLIIPNSHYAVFRIGIQAPKEEDTFVGEIFVETQYEVLKVPFSFRTAKGALSVASSCVNFGSTFPGKIASVQLYLHSSFSKPMTVLSVVSLPHDPRVTYRPPKTFPPILQPNARTLVGKLQFDIRSDCQQSCYTGFSIDSPEGMQWTSSFSLPDDVSLIDIEMYETLQSRWENFMTDNQRRINMTFQIDTSEVRGFRVDGVATLTWPNLSNKQNVIFPLTQIGNSSVKDILLENPSSVPVVAQIVPLHYYPAPDAIINVLEQSGLFAVIDSLSCNPDLFKVKNAEKLGTRSKLTSKDYQAHPGTVVVRLEPGSSTRVSIKFTPTDERERVSVLLIRNNLTVLETVLLTGTGAHGQLRFGNRLPGSSSPLLFELTDKHLRDCNQVSQYSLPHFTVRRAFTIRNTGQLPIYVSGFDINTSPCEGYGFRVLNCAGFLLSPNASKKVDIAFTPDFTMSYVQRVLNVHTSLGGDDSKLDFSLVATIPAYLLARCSSSQPRPVWEALLYYVAISMMCFLLFCVVVAAYLESDRIYRCTFVPMTVTALPAGDSSVAREFGKVFDLKGMSAKLSGKLPSDMRNSLSDRNTPKSRKNSCPSSLDRDGIVGGGEVNKPSITAHSNRSSCSLRSANGLQVGKKKLAKKTTIAKSSSQTSSSSSSSSSLSSSLSLSSSSLIHRKITTVSANNRKLWPVSNSSSSDRTAKSYGKCGLDGFSPSCFTSSSLSASSSSTSTPSSSKANEPKPWIASEKSPFNVCRSTTKPTSKNVHTNTEETVTRGKREKQHIEEERLSTTTESSCGDTDSSEREHLLKSKGGYRKVMSTAVNVTSNSCTKKEIAKVDYKLDSSCELEFTVKTKSKKVRSSEQSTKTDGATIACPLTLELPYTPKGTSSSKMKDLLRWEKAACQLKAKFNNKKPQPYKALHQSINDNANKNIPFKKDSPPPEWDHPRSTFNADEAYNEIASQTESFEIKKSRMGSGPPMSSRFRIPPLSTDSSRSNKPTPPVGKIAPEPKRVDLKQLGPVGQKPALFQSAPLPPTSCWNMPGNSANISSPVLGTPHTPPERANDFMYSSLLDQDGTNLSKLSQVSQSSSSSSSSLPIPVDSLFGPFTGATSGSSANIVYQKPWGSVANTDVDPFLDSKQKQSPFQGEDWLDFGLSKPTADSVWGLDGHSFNREKNIERQVNENPWGLNDVREKSGSPWPSAFPWSSRNVDRMASSATLENKSSEEKLSNVTVKESGSIHGFDPFYSLQNIWNSPVQSNRDQAVTGSGIHSNGNNWTNSFFRSPTNE